MKVSFKKDARLTGLAAIGNPHAWVSIKGDKKKVGSIIPSNWHQPKFKVTFRVKREPTPDWKSEFTNITLKAQFDTELEARQYIMQHWKAIQFKYDLHQMED